MVAHYVGIDGGGTKTQVFCFNPLSARGLIITGPASNPNTVSLEKTLHVLNTLTRGCLRALGATTKDLEGMSVCLSGVDRSRQKEQIREHLSKEFSGVKVEVVNDALAALTSGTRGDPGIVLIAGTGSIAVGESRSGKIARSGGFGYLIGDEGSGFYLGKCGLMSAIQYAEGRGRKTVLWQRAMEEFSVSKVGDLIPVIYESSHPAGTVATFARYVVEAAKDDDVAQQIVDEAIEHYALLIESVQNQLRGETPKQVVLAGGLFTKSDVLMDALRARMPEPDYTVLKRVPAAGAALRAVQFCNPTGERDVQRSVQEAWTTAVDYAQIVEDYQ